MAEIKPMALIESMKKKADGCAAIKKASAIKPNLNPSCGARP